MKIDIFWICKSGTLSKMLKKMEHLSRWLNKKMKHFLPCSKTKMEHFPRSVKKNESLSRMGQMEHWSENE